VAVDWRKRRRIDCPSFVGGVTAPKCGGFGRLQQQDSRLFLSSASEIIAEQQEDAMPVKGLIEVDESCFGGVRKGSGRGAAGKVPVFGSSSAAARSTLG
jgi:hypothetical protein